MKISIVSDKLVEVKNKEGKELFGLYTDKIIVNDEKLTINKIKETFKGDK